MSFINSKPIIPADSLCSEIENQTLSPEGYAFKPQKGIAGLWPLNSREICTLERLRHSPPPLILDDIPDFPIFQTGPDINVFGIVLKRPFSDLIYIPEELRSFVPLAQRCVNNEYGINWEEAHAREFVVTITRSNAVVGTAHRKDAGAGEWHVHLTDHRIDRIGKVPCSRHYSAADLNGTECYVGPWDATGFERNLATGAATIISIPERKIGIFSSLTHHRSPVMNTPGRRTVFVMTSRHISCNDYSFGNPLLARLAPLGGDERKDLIETWTDRFAALTGTARTPLSLVPPVRRHPQFIIT